MDTRPMGNGKKTKILEFKWASRSFSRTASHLRMTEGGGEFFSNRSIRALLFVTLRGSTAKKAFGVTPLPSDIWALFAVLLFLLAWLRTVERNLYSILNLCSDFPYKFKRKVYLEILARSWWSYFIYLWFIREVVAWDMTNQFFLPKII